MKKLTLSAGLLLATMLVISACQSKKDSSSSTNVVATTPATQCNLPGAQASDCDPSVYNTLNTYGFQAYPYNWQYNNGFCGCPIGTRPVMSQSFGIGCAPDSIFSFNSYSYLGWAYQPQNNHWSTIPQVSYTPVVNGTSNGGSCWANPARACDVLNSNNDCTFNGIRGECRKIGGGSRLGICTYQNGTDVYSNGSNSFVYNGGGTVNFSGVWGGGGYAAGQFGVYGGFYVYNQIPNYNCQRYASSWFTGYYCFNNSSTTSGVINSTNPR